jgi:hypothetical protein
MADLLADIASIDSALAERITLGTTGKDPTQQCLEAFFSCLVELNNKRQFDHPFWTKYLDDDMVWMVEYGGVNHGRSSFLEVIRQLNEGANPNQRLAVLNSCSKLSKRRNHANCWYTNRDFEMETEGTEGLLWDFAAKVEWARGENGWTIVKYEALRGLTMCNEVGGGTPW